MRWLVLLTVLGACDGVSGVLIVTSWNPPLAMDVLELETSVEGGAPTVDTIAGPLMSPYRLLVQSPPGRAVSLLITVERAGVPLARAGVSVAPDEREIVELQLPLQPLPPTLCGNLQLDDGEACDDGNREDRDGCSNACQCARCGDGILQGFGAPPPSIGECLPNPSEACDDGNTESGDGCSATCQLE